MAANLPLYTRNPGDYTRNPGDFRGIDDLLEILGV
jgi:hypothetical protein